MGEDVKKSVLLAGWLLAIAALLGTGMLWLTAWHAEPYIEDNERRALLASLNAVIPRSSYDNDLLDDYIEVKAPDITAGAITSRVYRARMKGQPVAAAITTVAPDGYNGNILILVGIGSGGVVKGVRIVKHRETPGLGDAIEAERSDWVHDFSGRSRNNPGDKYWTVKKDGGEFDQFSGATITPRAVVAAVHRSLVFYTRHRARLYAIENHHLFRPDAG